MQVIWGPDQQDALCRIAEDFKRKGDEIGIHIAAAADLEMRRYLDAAVSCPAFGVLLVDLAICHHVGASHDVAHMFAPELHNLVMLGTSAGQAKKQLEDLKRDARVD